MLEMSGIEKDEFHCILFVQISIMALLNQGLLSVSIGVKVWIFKGEVLSDAENLI